MESLSNILNSAIKPLKQALAQGEAEEHKLLKQLEAQKNENAKAHRALAILDPTEKHDVGTPTRVGAKVGTGSISKDKVQEALNAIRELDHKRSAITQPKVRDMTTLKKTTTSKAFRYLRGQDVIGLSGIDAATGRDTYRVLDGTYATVRMEKSKVWQAKAKKPRKPLVKSAERIEMVRRYLADYGVEGMTTRDFDGTIGFTVGALMNTLNKIQYAGVNWDRSKGAAYVLPLIRDGALVALGRQADGYRYLSLSPVQAVQTTWGVVEG